MKPPPPIDTSLTYTGTSQLSADFYLSKYNLLPRFLARYSLQEELGSGGFGFVCSAQDRNSGREVAVKFILRSKIPPQGWVNDPVFGVIPRECYLCRSLQHPNIISFVDYFQDPNFSYLITELHGSPWTDAATSANASPVPIHNDNMLSPPLTPLSLNTDVFTTEAPPKLTKRPPCDLFEYVSFRKEKRV